MSGNITEADAVRHDNVHGSVLLVGRAPGASIGASIRGDRTESEAAQWHNPRVAIWCKHLANYWKASYIGKMSAKTVTMALGAQYITERMCICLVDLCL